MAITKIYAIRDRLDKRVAYAANELKTGLHGMIEYAVNESKTEQRLFQSVINCECVDTVFDEMRATKRRWKKENGVLGYHFIQSFAPGEITPDMAHQIGIELRRNALVIDLRLSSERTWIKIICIIISSLILSLM
jgi:hypothetical protein